MSDPVPMTSHIFDPPKQKILQLGASTCAATAVILAYAMMDQSAPIFSRSFLNYNACRLRATGPYGGVDLKACLDVASNIGLSEETFWPYDQNHLEERPSLRAFESAYDHRFGNYYPIQAGASAPFSVKAALDGGSPVIIGTMIGKNFIEYQGGLIAPPSVVAQSHAFVICGWDETGGELRFRIQNTFDVFYAPSDDDLAWSGPATPWGDGPDVRGWMSPSYLTEQLLTTELYVPIRPGSP